MEMVVFSPLNLGIFLRLLSGIALMNGSQPALVSPENAQAYIEAVRPAPELQRFLEATVADLEARDPLLAQSIYTVALMDLNAPGGPRLAHVRGDLPMYPASVVKFVYLMAAFRWQEEQRLQIDRELRRQLRSMIYESSNRATQTVFYRLTGTQQGPELRHADYEVFRDRRFSVKRWVQSLGVQGVHAVHPTYDEREIYGREVQFFSDRSIQDGGQGQSGGYYNRLMTTANGLAQLLALLATDRAMSPDNCAAIREMMRRDIRDQPHLGYRIAGGAARLPGMEVFAKSGTFGRTYADAGIVRHVSGRQMVIVVLTEGTGRRGAYRGWFISDVTERAAAHVLLQSPHYAPAPYAPQRSLYTILPAVWNPPAGEGAPSDGG
jgi:hypothetical protein